MGCETILSGKARVVIIGVYEHLGQAGSYAFAALGTTHNSATDATAARVPNEALPPTTLAPSASLAPPGAAAPVTTTAQGWRPPGRGASRPARRRAPRGARGAAHRVRRGAHAHAHARDRALAPLALRARAAAGHYALAVRDPQLAELHAAHLVVVDEAPVRDL